MMEPKTPMLRRPRLWAALIALSLAALACNFAGVGAGDGTEPAGDASTGPTAEAEVIPTPTVEQEPTAAPVEETQEVDASADEVEAAPNDTPETLDFSSLLYDFDEQLVGEWTYEYDGDTPQDETLPLYIAGVLRVQRDPLVVALDYTAFEISGDTSMMDTVSADDMGFMAEGDTLYVMMSGQCLAFSVENAGEEAASGLVNPMDFVTSESQIEMSLVGSEQIDGVATIHYRAENVSYSGFEGATIDIWYVPDAGYIRRIIIVGHLTAYQAEGTTTITYDLMPAEQPEELVPPENCQSFVLPGS
jgi:hypothetical protein